LGRGKSPTSPANDDKPSNRSNHDQIYDTVYFSASEWRTINGGLNRLPLSFPPLVTKDPHMNRSIERIQYTQKGGKSNSSATPKVELSWRDNTPKKGNRDTKLHTSTYDYALISAPFTVVRSWRLPNTLPTTITNAINNLGYAAACKVALEYSSRFWEHYENPIIGGCSTTTDIPGIGSICYPSYNINGTGKATILASYSQVDWPASLSEEEHVKLVLDAMTEIHGEESRKLYTGKYNRRCWAHDPLEGGASWANPSIGQHQLYIPEYFKTYDGVSCCSADCSWMDGC
jgi:monoamine oxidase